MATPATPVSVAAPAAPSAPAAAPSAPATPAPSAPATPPAAPVTPPAGGEAPPAAQPEPGQPAAAPAAAPSTPYDPKTAAVPPVATDWPNTNTGQQEFLKNLNTWHREHPDGEKPAAPPAEAPKTPEEQALADSLPPAAPAADAPPETAPTPQALSDMMKDVPEFGQFLETDAGKKVKGSIFKMSRELAEVAPIREIVPTVEDAKFMQEYSGHMVGLKAASLRMVNDPAAAGDFFTLFDGQFERVDGEGKSIIDPATGQPTYDPDRGVVLDALVNREVSQYTTKYTSEINDLKTKLAGHYPNDMARNIDQKKLDNLEYAMSALGVLDQIRDGSFFEDGPPEIPTDATAEQKAWFEEQQAKLAKQKQELDDQKRGNSKEERSAQTQKFQESVRGDMGSTAGTVIGNSLKAIIDSGVYIPEFYMQEKYVGPDGKETNTSAIGARLFLQLENELMRPGSRTLMEIMQHELLPQNEQTREIRKAYYARKAADIVPRLVQAEVDRIQSLVKIDQQKQAERSTKRNEAAQPEPSTGSSSLPAGASREQVLAAAEEAAKKHPEWADADGTKRQGMIITQVHRMSRK